MTAIPMQARLLAALAGVNARDFAIGWANGLVRWQGRDQAASGAPGAIAGNHFPLGSVKRAASEAAVTFCREREK